MFQRVPTTSERIERSVILGAHKYIAQSIKGTVEGPKISDLIGIFNKFSQSLIKDYVYTRMTKSILLELALTLLQAIASGGAEHSKSLTLVIEKTKKGGKQVVLSNKEPPQESQIKDLALDDSFLEEIDEAMFCLKDETGASPDFAFKSGAGLKPPYSPFGKNGEFVPEKRENAAHAVAASEVYLPISKLATRLPKKHKNLKAVRWPLAGFEICNATK